MTVLSDLSGNSGGRLRRLPWFIGCLLVILVPGLFALDRARHYDRILGGVTLGPVVLSELKPEDALVRIQAYGAQTSERKLLLRLGSEAFELSLSQLGIHPALRTSVDNAYAEGRRGHLGKQLWHWLCRFWKPSEVPLATTTERSVFERELRRLEGIALGIRPQVGGIVVDGKRAIPVYAQPGKTIDRAQALTLLVRAATSPEDQVVELPLSLTAPATTREQVNALVALAEKLLSQPVTLRGPASSSVDSTESAPTELVLDASFFGNALVARYNEETRLLQLALDEKALAKKLEGIRQKLERLPRDAQFSVENADAVSIKPSTTGTLLADSKILEAALKAAASPERQGNLPLTEDVQPKLTTEAAEALNIRRMVGHFRTSFPCCAPRVKNIARIAELLNHTIVPPGATFSVNEAVGPRTLAAGFVPAPSIEDGEMVDTVGGGVSQFATTLYNALFHAGYEILTHQPHSYYFNRYPMGHEATLSWPKPDLAFRNDTRSGLLILTQVGKTSVSVLLFGDTEGRRVTVKVSPQSDFKQPPVQLLPAPTVRPDSEAVVHRGKAGWSVDVSRRIDFADGTSRSDHRKVTYNPEARVVSVHPCRIPPGEPGATGEDCPLPEPEPGEDAGAPQAE
ncbi:MAG: VanW family protein [Polyangiaceae bacterium]|nr:VanW family protein [Polyangiaceae bacterium]